MVSCGPCRLCVRDALALPPRDWPLNLRHAGLKNCGQREVSKTERYEFFGRLILLSISSSSVFSMYTLAVC